MFYPTAIYCTIEPRLAVIAELAISDAKRAITVPFADGIINPSMVAMLLPVDADEALQAVGRSAKDSPSFTVLAVAVKEYSDLYRNSVNAGVLMLHREPVVVAADVY